jgi:DNA repair protein RadC
MRKPKVVCETPVYKVLLVQDSSVAVANKCVRSPEDAAKIVTDYLRGADREHFVGLYLNSANSLITVYTISVGTLNSSLVHPREVFKIALMVNAAAVIVAHNHPSGNLEPSHEDISITKQLVEAGKILGVPLHDHIIVSEGNGYTSFAERGLMSSNMS